ncbi:MAG: helix-turn-helix transcriptional regulator [bacterium]|nr:helix-turn-helix transcriptional regulator [bacterium]
MTGRGERSGRSERSDRTMGAGRARAYLNYGRAIRRLRRERGMTRDALATESGVSPSYLYEVERGYKRPSTDVLASVAEALGRSPSEMLAYIEVMSEALPETPDETPIMAQIDEPPGESDQSPDEPDQPQIAAYRVASPRMETPNTRRERAFSRFNIEPAIGAHQAPSPETGSLRALLAVLEYLSEDDLRILLALARRLAGGGM